MELKLLRYSDNGESTLGLLFVNKEFQCYTLEDERRTKKVYGETRIPEGRYKLDLRKVGGFHQKYSGKFGEFHRGMIHLRGVPNFKYVLIHIGNDDDDTAGCLLVGNKANNNKVSSGFIQNSTDAYKELYQVIVDSVEDGECFITIKDVNG